MKRYVVGTLLFSIVMFVQLFGDIPVFADAFVPTSSYEFTGLADLGYALVGGAEFDFEGSPYIIDNYNSLSAEQKEIQKSLAARQFLKDYMESRNIAFEEDGELHPGSTYYTIAFGLAGQEFFEAFQTATAAEQENLEYNMPISPSRFADWAQFNKYWFKRYASDFSDSSEIVIPNPDSNYLSYINYINPPFFIAQESISYPVSSYIIDSYYNYSFICTFQSNGIQSNPSGLFYNSVTNIGTMSTDFIDVYINYDINTEKYIVTHSNIVPVRGFHYHNNSNTTQYDTYYIVIGKKSDNLYGLNGSYNFSDLQISNWNFDYLNSQFNNLDDALNFVRSYYSNINLYVNGELWALASDPAPANPTIPDFPDIINQDTGELAYDIAMPKTQDYSGSFDLTSLFDAIREGIAGASDGDLATGSTIGSLDVGRTYTGEGIDIQDRVIDLTSSRVFDGTLTDDTTGRLPKPPVVPPAVSAGLGGVTVLAKYVDATQCILPEDLVTAFWGCVWILIMLGLIKNLHR